MIKKNTVKLQSKRVLPGPMIKLYMLYFIWTGELDDSKWELLDIKHHW